jgi:uncharacterized membrane protein YhaH (DUF805 family)
MVSESNNQFIAFIFPKRLGRLSYFLRLLSLFVLMKLSFYAIGQCQAIPELRLAMTLAFAFLFIAYLFCYVLVPRLLDFGLPVIAVIVFFIPLFNTLLCLGLMFGPQDYWEKFRLKTKQNSK